MNDLQTTIGIVLQAIAYREYDRIISLFTPHFGILKLFVKGSYKNQIFRQPYAVPLAKGEYIFRETRSLPRLEEATLLSAHSFIRDSLENLENAIVLTHALIKSQSEGKRAPELFMLFSSYLEALPKAPETLASSFLLKILKYEGLWQKDLSCQQCKKRVQETCRLGGVLFCSCCAPIGALRFSWEEEQSLIFLSESRSLNDMIRFSFPEDLRKKISLLFDSALND